MRSDFAARGRMVPATRCRVDVQNPLAQGLIFACLPGRHLVGSFIYNYDFFAPASLVWGFTPEGPGGANQFLYTGAGAPFQVFSAVTIWCRQFHAATQAADTWYVSISTTTSPFTTFILSSDATSSAHGMFIGVKSVNTVNNIAITGSGQTANTWYDHGATWVPGGKPAYYRNGALFFTDSTNRAAPTAGAGLVGCAGTATALNTAVYIWNRALSAAEMAQLSIEPYGLFEPRQRLMQHTMSGDPARGLCLSNFGYKSHYIAN